MSSENKKTKVTAVFDIGKTNKKFFLFDQSFQEVYQEYTEFSEISDSDGFPMDDLNAIQKWVIKTFNQALKKNEYKIESVNFSTYGASFIHIDKKGKPLTPLYNYLKPFPNDLATSFYKKYGGQKKIEISTGSPASGMLNSGLQLYWLKHTQPEIWSKVRYSLHFPQYLSYIFTGVPISDYTSIGCHTGLWDYEKKDYHDWVYAEDIHLKLPAIVTPDSCILKRYKGNKLKFGTGIHDSSAALIPYLKVEKRKFLLVSTGTWSISLNPFTKELMTDEDLKNDCLYYMRMDGSPVKASRLFMGNEYKLQVEKLHQHFGHNKDYHLSIAFDQKVFRSLALIPENKFHFESLDNLKNNAKSTDLNQFNSFEEAYHQLLKELVDLQVESIKTALGDKKISRIYIDGGFTNNDLYMKLLSLHFPDFKIRTTSSPLGSALGAAMVIGENRIPRKFLKKTYGLKNQRPLIFHI